MRAAGATSRRAAIRSLTAAGLSALVGAALGQNGAARRKKRKKRRKNRKRCADGSTRCGETCVRGACCPGTACGSECLCLRGVGGDAVCTQTQVLIGCVQCTSDDDCPSDRRCVERTGCLDTTAVCVPECES